MVFVPIDIIDDRVEETAVIGGLGNYVLKGTAVPGQQTFASVMTIGQTTWVFCYDPTSFAWEVDRVTFASGNQLQRTEMLASSTGSPINFPGNLCQIGMTIPAAFVLEVLTSLPSGSAYTFGTISFGAGAVAQNGTITITLDQDVDAHLLEASYSNGPGGGTIDAAVVVNGSTAAGFGSITIEGTGDVTGSAEVPAGSVLQVVFTDASGTISDGGAITLSGTQD